jgi:hypothetical protein
MKTTIKFNTNDIGNAALLINPWFLCDSLNLSTGILINNDPNLNLINNPGMTDNFTGYSMQSRVTANTASAYRLVSACLNIYPEMSISTAQGYIAGGIVTRSDQASSYNVTSGFAPFGGAAAIASIIDQTMFYQKSQIGGQAGVRAIYLPFDPSFDIFLAINAGRADILTSNIDQFYWNYYVTGTQPTAPLVCEIYYNFELEPLQEGILQLMTTQHLSDKSDPALEFLSKNPELITQSSSNLLGLSASIDEAVIHKRKGNIPFLDKTIDWMSNHSGDVLNILSTVARLF